ncbi:MAG: thiamine pyrophosphate-binding protein [Chloroflexi bacterium]|nr:thiamine pyrophosphate-binding protein [Chloroflexota bacterium]
MKVADLVGLVLAQLGVRQVFGLLGSGNFVVTNALLEHGAAFTAARHEGGAITMADAYARVSGEVGVCTVHQGPGLTNAMTGLTEAAKSRTPLLVLAADTAASALRSNFRIEQDNLVRSVGAVAERLHSPATAGADVTRAFLRAQRERRAVVLMLPLDVQAADAPPAPASVPSAPRLRPTVPAEAAIREAADLLLAASRPLIIAGRGAVLADAREPLERLAELRGALLATSANGNGLFAGNPWCVGISGGFASPAAVELIAQADVVLSVGAGLNMWTTRHGRLLGPDAHVIQIDREAEMIGAHTRVDIPLLGDAGEAVTALIDKVERRGPDLFRAEHWRSEAIRQQIAAGTWKATPCQDAGTETHIDPRTLSRLLDDLLPDERTLAVDSGHFMGYPSMYLRVPDAQGFVFTQAFQAVGLGLASAIGAAIARPDRLTVAALGDGGAMMALPELETVARYGLHMLIVVYNDAAYGAEVHHFGPMGHPVELVQFPDVDVAALARAAGIEGATIRRAEDLAVVERWLARGERGALLLDAKVVPTVVAEWLEEAFRGH